MFCNEVACYFCQFLLLDPERIRIPNMDPNPGEPRIHVRFGSKTLLLCWGGGGAGAAGRRARGGGGGRW
jgi:hypothetical protein